MTDRKPLPAECIAAGTCEHLEAFEQQVQEQRERTAEKRRAKKEADRTPE